MGCVICADVGRFTVVDDKLVDEDDLQNNFFVSRDFLGRPRAEAAVTLLRELNETVTAVSVTKVWLESNFLLVNVRPPQSASELISGDLQFFLG